jgi:NADPH:quinone reductase-like Zn-dependent oxidoreductase
MDLLQREGKYPLPPQAGPTMGVEFSGTIEEFGEDAEEGFKIGDEVFGLAYSGMSCLIMTPLICRDVLEEEKKMC